MSSRDDDLEMLRKQMNELMDELNESRDAINRLILGDETGDKDGP